MLKYLPLSVGFVAVASTAPAFGQLILTQSHSATVGGTVGPPDAADVAVFDLDEDGFMDIVTFNSEGVPAPPAKLNYLAILHGNGDGTFQPVVDSDEVPFNISSIGEQRSRLMVGEFNGDTHPDLVLTHQATQEVALILNDGAGGFLPAVLFDTGATLSSLHVDDYNEDGLDDVLTVSLSGYDLSFLAGTGTGLAAPVGMPSGLGSAHQPWTFDVGDVDNDGHLDVVIPYLEDETGALVNQAIGFTGNGDGTFDMATPFHVDLGPVLASSRVNVQIGDLDTDGYQDVVAVRDFYTGGTDDHLHVAYGNATGWDPAVPYVVSGQEWLTECVIADLDFDGHLDIATICNGPFALEILLGDGARGFTAQGQIDTSPAAGMFAIVAEDINDDLKLDIVLGYQYTGHVIVYRNDTPGSVHSGVGYCFGDLGSGTPCPCANDNDGSVPGSGCANGVFASGAQLIGTGSASVSFDTLVLATTGLEPNNSGLYFQADNDLSPGNIWGDGLQCAGGQLKRLGVRFSDASGHSDTSGYPQPISVKAGNVLPGDTKYYQCWYRTTVNPPCGAGVNDFNSSNGYAVIWQP